MKTKEELEQIKEEVKTLNEKLAELSDDELSFVAGGNPDDPSGFQISERMRVFGGLAVPVTPFGETTTAAYCPHCMRLVKGTVEQVDAHITACQG